MSFDLFELWSAMGPLARAVMVLLLAMSLASVAVAFERVRKVVGASRESETFVAAWRAVVGEQGLAAAAAEAARFPASHAAHLAAETTRVLAESAGSPDWLEAFDRTARRIIVATGIDLRRGLGLLATVGSTAPFVGLFGTVLGIVSAFHTMGVTGQGGLGSVATGISEALVATALGILVAIPALWIYNALTQRIQRTLGELECFAEEIAVEALASAHRDDAVPLATARRRAPGH